MCIIYIYIYISELLELLPRYSGEGSLWLDAEREDSPSGSSGVVRVGSVEHTTDRTELL